VSVGWPRAWHVASFHVILDSDFNKDSVQSEGQGSRHEPAAEHEQLFIGIPNGLHHKLYDPAIL